MKQSNTGVWVVVAFILLAGGLVAALSIAMPGRKSDSLATSSGGPAGPAVVSGGGPTEKDRSLSPVIGKIDGFQFLDLIPLYHQAPDFIATAADGKPLTLSGFRGKKNLVLIFYQGSFCTVCGAQLQNLQKHLADFKAQDAEIIAISADDAAHALQTVGDHGLAFHVVPDPKTDIIQKYGVINVNKILPYTGEHLAWPAVYVIDKKGLVQLNFASKDGHRLHSNEILPVLSKLTHKSAPFLTNYND